MKNTVLTLLSIVILNSLVAQTWNQITVPTDKNLNDVDFPNSLIGYIAGDEGVLLKTTDGGENWVQVSFTGISSPESVNIIDVEFVTSDIGYMVTENMVGFFKTTDGGQSWVQDTDFELGNLCYTKSIFAFDENHLFLAGAGCFQGPLIKEYNNGAWSEKTVNLPSFDPIQFIEDMDFSNNYALATTHSHLMLRSIDNGQTWDTIQTPLSEVGFLTEVVIVNETTAYAGYDEDGGGFGVLVSVDGGLTWNMDMNSATFYYPAFLSLEVAANGDLYVGAKPSNWEGGLIFENTDGVNWNIEVTDQAIYAMDSYNSDVVFAVGDSGYVAVNLDLSQLSIEEQNLSKLSIYPNPAVDFVSIFIENGEIENFKLVDANMKELTIEFTKKDSRHFEADISQIAEGIYYLMPANSVSVHSKPLMIIRN